MSSWQHDGVSRSHGRARACDRQPACVYRYRSVLLVCSFPPLSLSSGSFALFFVFFLLFLCDGCSGVCGGGFGQASGHTSPPLLYVFFLLFSFLYFLFKKAEPSVLSACLHPRPCSPRLALLCVFLLAPPRDGARRAPTVVSRRRFTGAPPDYDPLAGGGARARKRARRAPPPPPAAGGGGRAPAGGGGARRARFAAAAAAATPRAGAPAAARRFEMGSRVPRPHVRRGVVSDGTHRGGGGAPRAGGRGAPPLARPQGRAQTGRAQTALQWPQTAHVAGDDRT